MAKAELMLILFPSSLLCVGKQCYVCISCLEDRATLESDPSAVAGPVDGRGSMPCLGPNDSSMGLHAINSRGSGGPVPQSRARIELSGYKVHHCYQIPG